MLRALILLASLLGTATAVSSDFHPSTDEGNAVIGAATESRKQACRILQAKHNQTTFFEGSAGYAYETQTQYWSATAYDRPACVFVPQDAEQVSFAVSTLSRTHTEFAVRSGGHMPVLGYNSIGPSGVLLSMSNLTALDLSKDEKLVSVGPGNRWRDVYSYLEPYGLAAVGGRVGGVGVAGLLLGGGISFHSSQYGFGSDNIVRYEAVLASGRIVEATADNHHSDLFWALKGGGNSLAIVTRFDIRTIPSTKVWVGVAQYAELESEKYLDAVYNFGKHGSADDKAAIIPTIVAFPSLGVTAYAAAKFYDSETPPETAFENFTAPVFVPVADDYKLQSLAQYVRGVDALQPTGLRQDFRVYSLIVDRDAVDYVHDTFIQAVKGELTSIDGLTASISFQPVTKDFIEHGVNRGGTNPQGVDPNRAPYFWVVQNLSWENSDDDEAARKFAQEIAMEIEDSLRDDGLKGEYLYMNDAGRGQPVFESYPDANLERLKTIRHKYDPSKVYIDLLTGGWKILDAGN